MLITVSLEILGAFIKIPYWKAFELIFICLALLALLLLDKKSNN